MKIAFLSLKDMRTDFWSGTPQAMVAALERQGAEVRTLGAVDQGAFLRARLKGQWYRRLLRRTYLQSRDGSILRIFGERIEAELRTFPEADWVLTPFTATIAYLRTSKPVALWHDATFDGLLDYYPGYERRTLCEETVRSGREAERAALQRAELLLYTSEWAARSAIEDYGVYPGKVSVVPYGSNLPTSTTETEVAEIITGRRLSPVRFLFIGGEWARKGGNVAFNAMQRLNARGIPTELHIVGTAPEGSVAAAPGVHAYGRLRKSNPADLATLLSLFRTATFLLLPTKSDCTPIVFCEANAFGLPVLSTRTGGIPAIIKDNVNGRLFDLPDMADEICDYVSRLAASPEAYTRLRWSSFRESQHRLNWDISAGRVLERLRSVTRNTAIPASPPPSPRRQQPVAAARS